MNMPAYRQYPSKTPETPTEREKFLRKLGLEHLLRAWQWFECYQLGPYIAPYTALAKAEYTALDNLPSKIQSRGKIEIKDGYRIIKMPGSLTIYDFGDYMVTSAGDQDNFGATSTALLLKSVELIMETLLTRNANQIAFDENSLDAAKALATVMATDNEMLVYGFEIPVDQRVALEELYGRCLTKRQLKELTAESPE